MAKNIVVLSDGTGQEGGKKNNTNVYRIFDVAEGRTKKQVLFYDAGPGTTWQKVSGNAFGRGFTKNMLQAYEFIFQHYEIGDKIFLLGFSRGAATVRSLASFLHDFGVLPPSRPRLIEDALKIYKKQRKRTYKMNDKAKYYRAVEDFKNANGTNQVPIEFLGVYDSVAALGFPIPGVATGIDYVPGFRHRFHDFALHDSVKHAYHALAIDDRRTTFHPILWEEGANPDGTVEQVWFVGMHTDVGGGYAFDDGEAMTMRLANIPYAWLLQKATEHGLRLDREHVTRPLLQDAGAVMHNSMKPFYLRRKARSWPSNRTDRPLVHRSVIDRSELDGPRVRLKKRGAATPQRYDPWILELDHEVYEWTPLDLEDALKKQQAEDEKLPAR